MAALIPSLLARFMILNDACNVIIKLVHNVTTCHGSKVKAFIFMGQHAHVRLPSICLTRAIFICLAMCPTNISSICFMRSFCECMPISISFQTITTRLYSMEGPLFEALFNGDAEASVPTMRATGQL